MQSRIPWIPILVLVVSAALIFVLVTSFIGDSPPLSDPPSEFATSTPGETASVGASLSALREELTALQESLRPALQSRDEFINNVVDDFTTRLERLEEAPQQGLPQSQQESQSSSSVVHKELVLNIRDGAERPLFLIETTDEDGDNDGGYYSVRIHILVGQGQQALSSASRAYFGTFTRQMGARGDGSTSQVTEFGNSPSAADSPELRDVGAIYVEANEISEFQTEIRITAEILGSSPLAGVATAIVDILYLGFATPPRILEVGSNS